MIDFLRIDDEQGRTLAVITDAGVTVADDLAVDQLRRLALSLGAQIRAFHLATRQSPSAMAVEIGRLKERVRELEAPTPTPAPRPRKRKE